MNNAFTKLILVISILTSPLSVFSSEGHDGEHEEEAGHKDEPKDEHKDDHEGEHKDESADNHDEVSSSIGPDKGITEKGDHGLKLSSEAIKVMEIRMQAWTVGGVLIDRMTMVFVKDEKSVFRVRDGWIKRVPVQVLKRTGSSFFINSSELKDGDQIVNHGTGFLRIAEVFATEGATHAH